MSLSSWRKEFYPFDAKSCEEDEALEHSLWKWEGLTKANLEKHGMIWDGRNIKLNVLSALDVDPFQIDSQSCALCHHYLFPKDRKTRECLPCPLSQLREDIPCDQQTSQEFAEGKKPPYQTFVHYGQPGPMIKLLKRALKQAQQRSKKRENT